jgi:hypothetical protein
MCQDGKWYSQSLYHDDRTINYPEEDMDNKDRILLPDNLFIKMIDVELYESITKEEKQDILMKSTFDALTMGTLLPLNSRQEDWKIEDNFLFYKERCYVPDSLDLRWQIAHQYHDMMLTGHPGQLRTQELIQEHYWWPSLYTFVKNYVNGCAICQQYKINRHPSAPALQPVKSFDKRPFSLITIDFITNLLLSDGFNSIMVVVDHRSLKGVILEPHNKTIDAEGTATILLNYLYKWYRLPDKAISNWGPQFASHVFQELGRLLGIKLAMSMAHHPQTDGATEWANQEIEAYMSIFCGNNPET